MSQYLLTVSNVKLRQYITAISSHNLLIEYVRQRNIPRNERHCNKCTNNNGSLEDEYHFVIVYNAYYDLRTQYISTYYYRKPYMYAFIERFTTNNIITLNKHELFLIKSFERRNAVVNNQTYLRCIINFFLVSLSVHVVLFLFVLTCTCMLLFFQLITVLCICVYGLCACACVAYDLIKVMLLYAVNCSVLFDQ